MIIWGNGIIERYLKKYNYVQFILYLSLIIPDYITVNTLIMVDFVSNES